MSRENIFIDGTPLIQKHLSGVGQVVLETVRALDDDNYKSTYNVIIFLPIDEKNSLEWLDLKNISIKYLPFPHKFLSLFSRLPYSPPLDIFLGKGVYLFLNFRSWPLAFSKSITYIHDVAFLKYPQYIEPRNLRFLSKHVRRWIRQSTKVVAVSHATEKEIRQELPCATGKLEVVVNAVNTQLYRPQEQTAVDSIRKKYNLTDYLLFVSNIEPRKNIETLIEAYKASIGKKGTQLFIVGGAGWLNEPIMEAIKRSQDEGFAVMKNTYFVPDEDLPALMQGARSLVIPSWHEGFGLPLLQAISSGGRVIASDIPALREAAGLVNSDRITFFDPKSVGELMAELNATKKSKLSNKAGKIVKVRQWSDAVRELTVIIDSMKVRKR